MKVLIIGGTGFVGPHVVRRLCGSNHEVTVLHRGRTPGDLPGGVRHLHCASDNLGDRRYLPGMVSEFKRLRPDVILDMIPVTEACSRVAVSTFRGIAGRLVAISSQDVYRAYGLLSGTEEGDVQPIPIPEGGDLRSRAYPYRGAEPRPEGDPGKWLDDYDKILVERVVMGEPDLPGTILRFPMVYGPGDRQRRITEYRRRMEDGRPAILLDQGMADWRWTRGYAENVAEAVFRAIEDQRAVGRIYNVGEAEALSEKEWIEAIGRAAGWSGRVVIVPSVQLPESLRSPLRSEQDLVTDTRRLRRELEYEEPIAREEALTRTVAWDRRHPPKGEAPDYTEEDRILASCDR